MFHRLRLPFFFSGFAFLLYAIYVFVSTLRAKPELRRDLSERYNPFDYTMEQRKVQELRMDLAYAKRLRDDAYARIEVADYDNASTRLDQAKEYDPEGDSTSRDVLNARQTIAMSRMPPENAGPPGSTQQREEEQAP
jgi:hypothetical protein